MAFFYGYFCLAKKELNNPAFSLKFVTNCFREKLIVYMAFFYRYGRTLVLTSMFWDLRLDPLIFWINENISP